MTAEKTRYIEADIDYRDDSLSKQLDIKQRQLEEDTAQHFEDCHQDYLFAWCNQDNLAFHYGYWDSDKPYQQHQALMNKNQLLYDKVAITPQDRVLDAGCGIGGSSICRRVRPNYVAVIPYYQQPRTVTQTRRFKKRVRH